MPGKRKPKGKSDVAKTPEIQRGVYWTDSEAVWGGFINIKLDDEQKSSFYAWLESSGQAVSQLTDDAIGEGVKLGLAYDAENQCYICTYMGALVLGSSERYVSTSRAGTLSESLALAAWKHFVLADGDYGNYRPMTGRLNNWG